jgi:hypothetical protein
MEQVNQSHQLNFRPWAKRNRRTRVFSLTSGQTRHPSVDGSVPGAVLKMDRKKFKMITFVVTVTVLTEFL